MELPPASGNVLVTACKTISESLMFQRYARYARLRWPAVHLGMPTVPSGEEIGKFTIGTGMFGVGSPMEIAFNVNMCVKGNDWPTTESSFSQTHIDRERCVSPRNPTACGISRTVHPWIIASLGAASLALRS